MKLISDSNERDKNVFQYAICESADFQYLVSGFWHSVGMRADTDISLEHDANFFPVEEIKSNQTLIKVFITQQQPQ